MMPNLRQSYMQSMLGQMGGIGPVGTTGLVTPSDIPPTAPVFKPDPFTPAEDEDSRPKDKNSNECRRKRLAVTNQVVKVTKYGSIIPITDIVCEVLQAPSDVWVVVIVYKDGCPECGDLMQSMEQLAAEYSATKFVKILFTDCIPSYPDQNLPTVLPDQNLPTVLVYKNGAVEANYTGSPTFDRECTLKGVAQILSQSHPVLNDGKSDGEASRDACP